MKQVNATLNFLLCLELALMHSSSQIFRLKAYKHCLLLLADLWYIGNFLKKNSDAYKPFFVFMLKKTTE